MEEKERRRLQGDSISHSACLISESHPPCSLSPSLSQGVSRKLNLVLLFKDRSYRVFVVGKDGKMLNSSQIF